MKHRLTGTLAIALGLSACASTGTTTDQAGPTQCQADAAAALVGQTAPDDATIRRQTGSALVRRIAPGDPTTKDYRIDRVTVTVSEGRVVAASCG